jgi:hypothetical protein
VYCDNVSAVYLSANPVHHRRTKHIELDIHFVREQVALGRIRVLHVPTSQQFADIMTKGLPTSSFEEFRSSLCVGSGDASTAGGVEYICTVKTTELHLLMLLSDVAYNIYKKNVARKIRIYFISLQEVQINPNIIKNYIEVLGPPNDHYYRRSEPLTRRCRCSHTGVGLTLLMTVGKSSYTCP